MIAGIIRTCTHAVQVVHEQFERANLIIIDLVWKVQFAQKLAQYLLVLLYTDICHFYIAEFISLELTFKIVVK